MIGPNLVLRANFKNCAFHCKIIHVNLEQQVVKATTCIDHYYVPSSTAGSDLLLQGSAFCSEASWQSMQPLVTCPPPLTFSTASLLYIYIPQEINPSAWVTFGVALEKVIKSHLMNKIKKIPEDVAIVNF